MNFPLLSFLFEGVHRLFAHVLDVFLFHLPLNDTVGKRLPGSRVNAIVAPSLENYHFICLFEEVCVKPIWALMEDTFYNASVWEFVNLGKFSGESGKLSGGPV